MTSAGQFSGNFPAFGSDWGACVFTWGPFLGAGLALFCFLRYAGAILSFVWLSLEGCSWCVVDVK